MMEKLKEDTGAMSLSDVMRQAVYFFYQKYNKDTKYSQRDYIAPSTKKPKITLTQEEKAKQKKFDICYELGGTILEKNGTQNCVYKTYEIVNPSLVEAYENQVPFSMLEDRLIKSQYNPSKEECEKIMNQKND